MDGPMHSILDISCRKHQIHEFDSRKMAFNSTEIKILNKRQIEYKILCQLSDEDLLCYDYDIFIGKGRLFTINKNGQVSHKAWFDLAIKARYRVPSLEYYYKTLKAIKYQNYIYIMSDHSYMIRYNLLKNTFSTALYINNSSCQRWAILKNKILIYSPAGMFSIYDCSINSISGANIRISWGCRFISTVNKSFFMIDWRDNILKSEEMNPFKWTLLGRINLKRIFSKNTISLNYEHFTYALSKHRLYNFLYKFDLENFEFTKFTFTCKKKEAIFTQKLLWLRYISSPNFEKRKEWEQALKPIEQYLMINATIWVEKILNMSFDSINYLSTLTFEYLPFKDRKIIIIQSAYAYDIRRYLQRDPDLFNYKEKYFKGFGEWNEFCTFSLKYWSKQGIIIPNVFFMKWKGAEIKDIVDIFKSGKKGLIWILIGELSSEYVKFIDQNEDKIIIGYNPSDNPFRCTNEFLREAGEKEVDWRICESYKI